MWDWEGRAEVRTSCVWCVEIKRRGTTTTRSPVRDAKVPHFHFLFCKLFILPYAVPYICILQGNEFTFRFTLSRSFFPLSLTWMLQVSLGVA